MNRAGPGRTGANSRAPSLLPGAAVASAAPRARPLPFGVDLGAKGSGAEPSPAPRRSGRWGETKGDLVPRLTQRRPRQGAIARVQGRGHPHSPFEGLILQPNIPLLCGAGWGWGAAGVSPGRRCKLLGGRWRRSQAERGRGGPPSSPEFGCAGCTGRARAPELLRRRGRVVAVSPGDCVTPAVLWGKVNLSRAPPFAGLATRGLDRVLRGP